ncbi:MAG: cell division protein FtsQ/DivIB [Chitinophagales bacterium]
MSNKKTQILKFLQALMIIAFGGLFLFLIVSSSIKQQDAICIDIKIDIKDKDVLKFVKAADIKKMIHNGNEESIINQKVENINLKALEEKVEKNVFVDHANVYLNFEGVLKVDVVQKKPLYRIINNNNVSYYISEKAHRIPLSTNFTPRLIVATGFIPDLEDISKDEINVNLKQLIDFIRADKFWNAMIGQVEVKQNKDFVLIPKLKGHTVLLGSVENLDEKFDKLGTFYKEALKRTDWTKYKEINLKFKGQLICSK